MCLHSIRLITIVFFLINNTALFSQEKTSKTPYVLLISLDGFRHDYVERYKPPFLSMIKNKGLSAKSLIPIYPSKTFPNHLSMITGSHAEEHGIISNNFYNARTFEKFSMRSESKKTNPIWYEKNPIWVLLENNAIKTASFFWPASDVQISHTRPSYYKKYDGRINTETRIDQIIKWFQLEEKERPHFVSLYLSNVDHAGHKYGPLSTQVKEEIHHLDHSLKHLFDELSALPIEINTIIVSDHGMQTIDQHFVFHLSDYVDIENISYISGYGSVSYLYFKTKEHVEDIYQQLKHCPYMNVFKKKDIPENYHLSKAKNMGDILIDVISPHYMLIKKTDKVRLKGEHGYDPYQEKNMHGIFYATGPLFSQKKTVESFENTKVYSIIKSIFRLN